MKRKPKDRTIRIMISPGQSPENYREIEPHHSDAVTMFAQYTAHEIAVMPDIHAFKLNYGPKDGGVKDRVGLTIEHDGSLVLHWTGGGGTFKVEHRPDSTFLRIKPIPSPKKGEA